MSGGVISRMPLLRELIFWKCFCADARLLESRPLSKVGFGNSVESGSLAFGIYAQQPAHLRLVAR
jgi:hypothetical protein